MNKKIAKSSYQSFQVIKQIQKEKKEASRSAHKRQLTFCNY